MKLEKNLQPQKKTNSVIFVILIFLIFAIITFVTIVYYNITSHSSSPIHIKLLNNNYNNNNNEIDDKDVKIVVKKAKDNIEKGDVQNKIKEYEKIINKKADLWDVRLELVYLYDSIGLEKKAENEFRQVYLYKKTDVFFLIEITDFMMKIKNYNQALFYITKVENFNNPEVIIRLFAIDYKRQKIEQAKQYLNIYKLWVETNSINHIQEEGIIKIVNLLIMCDEIDLAIKTLKSKINYNLRNQLINKDFYLFSLNLFIEFNYIELAKQLIEKIENNNSYLSIKTEINFIKSILLKKQGKVLESLNVLSDLYKDNKLNQLQIIEYSLILYETKSTTEAIKILSDILPDFKEDSNNLYIQRLLLKANYILAKALEESDKVYESASISSSSILEGNYDQKIVILFVRQLIRKKLYNEAKRIIELSINNLNIQQNKDDLLESKYLLAISELRLKEYYKSEILINELEKENFSQNLINKLRIEIMKSRN